ncbi:MAG: hypothetical protein K8I27_02230 [Planctomycetes bacterium]|nr:hypothetical protein [Planctomycetota bacterium]
MRAAYRPAREWELELVVPFDIKRVLYRDGSADTRTGVADIQQWVSVGLFELFHVSDEFQVGVGCSFPTGAIEPRMEEGDAEESLQFGNGTFDPAARLRYSIMPNWWGLSFLVAGQLPFYTNRHGYKGAITGEASVSLRAQALDWLSFDVTATGTLRGSSYWDGEPERGYYSLLISASPTFMPWEWFYITPLFGYRVASMTAQGGSLPKLQFVMSLRVTFFW